MKREKGFTLYELLLVLSIIVLLNSMFPPTFMKARTCGQYSQCQSNMKDLGTALEYYADEHKGHYPEKLEMLTTGYIRTIPTCPSAFTNYVYTNSYRTSPDFKAYTFYCAGNNHAGVGAGRNYPKYGSIEGLRSR